MSSCEYCKSGFACGRLYAALRIVEAHPEYQSEVQFSRMVALLKARLAAAGWAYPDGERLCQLAHDDGEISRLTEQLIRAINQRGGHHEEAVS